MIEPDIRFDPDVTFGDMYKLVVSGLDRLEQRLESSPLLEIIYQIRWDIVQLKNLHYGKTENSSDV